MTTQEILFELERRGKWTRREIERLQGKLLRAVDIADNLNGLSDMDRAQARENVAKLSREISTLQMNLTRTRNEYRMYKESLYGTKGEYNANLKY